MSRLKCIWLPYMAYRLGRFVGWSEYFLDILVQFLYRASIRNISKEYIKLYLCMLVATFVVCWYDNVCKQFRPRSGPTEYRSWSGSKSFDTLIEFLNEFSEKVDFKKISADNKSIKNYPACKQFGTRSEPTECRSWFGSKPFGTLMCSWKKFLKKMILKHWANDTSAFTHQVYFVFQRVLEGNEEPALPAAQVRPTDGELYWFLDKPAASKLTSKI